MGRNPYPFNQGHKPGTRLLTLACVGFTTANDAANLLHLVLLPVDRDYTPLNISLIFHEFLLLYFESQKSDFSGEKTWTYCPGISTTEIKHFLSFQQAQPQN